MVFGDELRTHYTKTIARGVSELFYWSTYAISFRKKPTHAPYANLDFVEMSHGFFLLKLRKTAIIKNLSKGACFRFFGS
jgi:hypothetical protein